MDHCSLHWATMGVCYMRHSEWGLRRGTPPSQTHFIHWVLAWLSGSALVLIVGPG